MSETRTKNAKRNIVNGMVREVLSMVLAFVTRTMVLYVLGEQYLGLSGLFTSILNVLNLAELGFNTAVVYFLYRPIAENDYDQICAITAYLRRMYRLIGSIILVAGLAVLPFLPHLISGEHPDSMNVYVLYLIYLANSVFSYWFYAYNSILFTATQRTDIVSKVYLVVSFGTKLAQLVVLVIFHDYYLFALLMVLGTVLNNLLLHHIFQKKMPEYVPRGQISGELKRSIGKQMRAIFVAKIGSVARNGCDSIFLSAWFGLVLVASYDNYMYIFNAIMSVVWMVGGAIQASVGNCMVKESLEKNRFNFFRFDFLFSWFVGWCTVCMFCLYQPFIRIWMKGKESLLLSDFNMMLICLYFYSTAICLVQNVYANGAGLFSQMRNWFVLEALGNLILNAILGYIFGVSGIIVATTISIVVCNFFARSQILFRNYFKTSAAEYVTTQSVYFAVMIIGCITTSWVCNLVEQTGILGLLLRMGICVIVPNCVFAVLHCRNQKFRDCLGLVKEIVKTK